MTVLLFSGTPDCDAAPSLLMCAGGLLALHSVAVSKSKGCIGCPVVGTVSNREVNSPHICYFPFGYVITHYGSQVHACAKAAWSNKY